MLEEGFKEIKARLDSLEAKVSKVTDSGAKWTSPQPLRSPAKNTDELVELIENSVNHL